MLAELSIRSFVLVDRLDLDLRTGLTAVTGETGAGKSILLDAIGMLVGGAAGRDIVRPGSDRAIVSGTFDLSPDHAAWTCAQQFGVVADANEPLILVRQVAADGRSRAFVNGQPVPVKALRDTGALLLEVFAHNTVSSLLDSSSHRQHLDAYADHPKLINRVRESYSHYCALRDSVDALEDQCLTFEARRNWLQLAVDELTGISPSTGEATRLSDERALLRDSAKLYELLAETESALTAGAFEEALSAARRSIGALHHRVSGKSEALNTSANSTFEAIERAMIEVEEARHGLCLLRRNLEHRPDQYAQVESRLYELRTAGRKHQTDPDQLSELLEAFREELAQMGDQSAALECARQELGEAFETYCLAAEALSEIRKQAAKRLEKAVAKELKPLHMKQIKFQVDVSKADPAKFGPFGIDTVQFLAETLSGHGLGALNKIASSGELARFALALKCALSESKSARCLFFDEADQGVGGAVAAAIGKRLLALSTGRQVVAITHSPQVASCADQQWQVRKQTRKSATISDVTILEDQDRLEEIARMLSGASVTDEARAAASKLLEVA